MVRLTKKVCAIAIFAALATVCISTNTFAAEIEVDNFTDFQTAIAAGNTVKLGANITATSDMDFSAETTLDLNGKELNAGWKKLFINKNVTITDTSENKDGQIYNIYYVYMSDADVTLTINAGRLENDFATLQYKNSTVVMNGGTIAFTDCGSGGGVAMMENAKFVMNGGKITSECTTGSDTTSSVGLGGQGAKFTMNGGEIVNTIAIGISAFANTEVIINDGTINTRNQAVSTSGSVNPATDTYGENAKVTINGGALTSDDYTAVYLPSAGGITEINGGTITGKAGVEIRAGTLTIKGGTITATADVYSAHPEGNGSTTLGAAIAVVQHRTRRETNVTVCGGTFKAAIPFAESNEENGSITDTSIKITECNGIDQPTFETTGNEVVYSEDFTNFIEAGIFTPNVDNNYIATGYTKKARGAGYMVSNAWLEVTVETPENGTASASLTDVLEGEEVEITTTPDAGYELDTITVKDADGADVTVNNGKFTMPAKNVTVTATFKKIKRAITITSPENGTATASAATAAEGDEVTVTTTAADGYELDAITVKDADGAEIAVTNGKFTMPAKAVTIAVTFKELPEEPATTPEEPKTSDTAENPNTYDDIAVWFVMMGASIAGLGAIIAMKKF